MLGAPQAKKGTSMAFKALLEDGEAERFLGPNDAWAQSHLPSIRMALHLLTLDELEMERPIIRMIEEGVPPGPLVEGMRHTRDHLRDLVGMLDAAMGRQASIMEHLGCGPANVPSVH
jgi:hypothetical protein